MMNKLMWCVPVVALGIAAGVQADRLIGAPEATRQDVKPAVSLPLTRVVLFNSGVGYFSRSGDVEGDARVDLSFPEQDINDLLKSMILEDFGNGRVAAVSYDSQEPISRTLTSFAVNLNGQPTFAGLVSQMRGERVEIVLSPSASNQSGRLSGVIVGVELREVAGVGGNIGAAFMNLWCAEGLRSVKLADVQQLKFANPVIENEFRRALDVLATAHDSQKKSVSLHFAGDNKRKVQVGYVVEAPIWKTSYRMVLSEKEKPYLQGWAMVENTTDEDWAGVKMALVSGRPISFKMDLHNPLYVDRPTVEPELFASLRPVAYRSGVGPGLRLNLPALGPLPLALDFAVPLNKGPSDHKQLIDISVGVFGSQGDDLKTLFGKYHELVKVGKFAEAEKVAMGAQELAPDNPAIGALVTMAKTQKRLKEQEMLKDDKEKMVYGGLTDAEREGPVRETRTGSFMLGGSFNTNQGVTSEDPLGIKLDAYRRSHGRGSLDNAHTRMSDAERKQHAASVGQELASRIGTGSVGNAATAAALGDSFQYAIDHPVNLARQKSAMLPIVGKTIEGQKVSIYNENVQRSHPLLGLKFKNTSGAHLNQGPITVFEGNVYAGDTRVLDVNPNEERLVSYAIDLGTEVDVQLGAGSQKIVSVKAVKGLITQTAKLTEEKKYRVINRSQTDRTVLIEHANRTSEQFKLVDTDKPTEDTPNVFRFQLAVKAGETKTLIVKEEKLLASEVFLSNNVEEATRYFTNLTEASPKLKAQLQAAMKVKESWDNVSRELVQVLTQLSALNVDQDRIRKNLHETPKEAEVYGTYLKKLSAQEKEIDVLTEKQKKLLDDELKARRKFEEFLANISD
ncbi:MAG: DUF4139 domain-containing protein [Planctomycetes bacterium]|nr:DUF4139 domain-containing protein [Planctomycetota bacterium]